MESTSKVRVKSNFIEKDKTELPIEDLGEVSYNLSDTVEIRSLMDATVKVTGKVTGTQYVWSRAGDIQTVDNRDKDEILNKKRGRACCGGQSGKALFEIA